MIQIAKCNREIRNSNTKLPFLNIKGHSFLSISVGQFRTHGTPRFRRGSAAENWLSRTVDDHFVKSNFIAHLMSQYISTSLSNRQYDPKVSCNFFSAELYWKDKISRPRPNTSRFDGTSHLQLTGQKFWLIQTPDSSSINYSSSPSRVRFKFSAFSVYGREIVDGFQCLEDEFLTPTCFQRKQSHDRCVWCGKRKRKRCGGVYLANSLWRRMFTGRLALHPTGLLTGRGCFWNGWSYFVT